MKNVIIFLMISFLVFSFNGLVFAKDEPTVDVSVSDVVGDILCVRPLGFVDTALRATFFVISLPVTTPLKKREEAREFLITDPYDYYFKRPLGEW